MNESNQVAYGAMLLAIYTLLLLASLFIPFFIIISLFVLPLPFILYTYRFGKTNAVVFFVATLIVSAILNFVFALPLTLLLGLGGLLIGDGLHNKRHSYEVLSKGTAGFVIGIIVTALLLHFVFDVNIVTAYEEMMEDSYQVSESFMIDVLNQELTEEQREFQREQLNQMKDLLPSILVIIALIIALGVQWVGYKWINRMKEASEKLKFPPFRNLRIPSSFIWLYLLVLILGFVQFQSEQLNIGIANLIILVKFVAIVHGLAFIYYYTFVKKWSIAIPIIILIASLLMPIVLFFVQLLGIIDLGFQLRDRLSSE